MQPFPVCSEEEFIGRLQKAIMEMALEKPALGQVRVANELTKRGLFVSPTGVRSVWLRHDLETFRKRLKALEAKAAQEHIILTEDRAPIHDLNRYRVGWELIEDWSRYQCFGLGRAAIVQLSRGCPRGCWSRRVRALIW